MSDQPPRPISILIAALGGEGGGVLTQWIVSAASSLGYTVQSTSIPGVAQRTGSTTYYIEILPLERAALGNRRPILALAPAAGEVDIVVASELLEAGRAIANGFVTRDRTLLIASTERSYIVTEKMAMGDGRFDPVQLTQAAQAQARTALLFDMDAVGKESGAMVNAVMFGAIAGCGRLPIPISAFEAAIHEDGKAVEANLRGFRAGIDAMRRSGGTAAPNATDTDNRTRPVSGVEQEITEFAESARDILRQGLHRLIAYQDPAYAQLYLSRLRAVALADARTDVGGRLLRETARHLAVRMSYEDVIRVAQAKTDPARLRRIEASAGATPATPVVVTEFLKPGIEELCSLLPPGLARRILHIAERRGWTERLHWAMEIKTTSISGYARLRLLAKLRRWRSKTFRFQQEQAAIEAWLALVLEASELSAELAIEVAECARLIKGYGDTLRRGQANYATIAAHVIRPALARRDQTRFAADAVASARTAALSDPDGEALARCIEMIERRPATAIAAE